MLLQYVPIILLTSRTDEIDRVVGLEMGADDYITKPFSPRELVARVKSLFRRIEAVKKGADKKGVIKSENLALDTSRRILKTGDTEIDLTSTEFAIIKLFMGRPGKVFTREELISFIWGDDFTGETRTVDVHVKNLRKKIGSAGGNPGWIRSVWGVGYTFED